MVPNDVAAGVWQKVGFTITVDVNQFACFHVAGVVDGVFGPILIGIRAGVFEPTKAFGKIIACDDIDSAIAIHIQR